MQFIYFIYLFVIILVGVLLSQLKDKLTGEEKEMVTKNLDPLNKLFAGLIFVYAMFNSSFNVFVQVAFAAVLIVLLIAMYAKLKATDVPTRFINQSSFLILFLCLVLFSGKSISSIY